MWQKNTLKFLFSLLFLTYPLGDFAKPDLLVSIIFVFWLIFVKKSSKPPLFKPFIIFFLISLISLIINLLQFSQLQILLSSLYLARLVVYAGLYFVIFDFPDKKFIIKGLIFSGIAFSAIGLLQYIFFPDMRMMKYLGWDDHYYRIVSSFFDPNFAGVIYACSSLLILRKNKYLFILPFIALLFTYSRTAYISFFAGLSIYLIQTNRIKYIFLSLIIILFILKTLPTSSGGEGVKLDRTSSINNRLLSMQGGINTFLKNPVFGVGYNTYKFLPDKNIQSHSASGVENSYILVLATTGIIGFLAFLNIIVKLPPKPEVIAILVSGLFINSLFYPWVMIWLFLIIALDF